MRPFRRLAGTIAIWALAVLTPVLYAQSNTVKSIQTVGANVEITVKSAQEFDVRDEVVALQIGSQIFSNSHPPADGDTHTLIFVLTQAEWDSQTARCRSYGPCTVLGTLFGSSAVSPTG